MASKNTKIIEQYNEIKKIIKESGNEKLLYKFINFYDLFTQYIDEEILQILSNFQHIQKILFNVKSRLFSNYRFSKSFLIKTVGIPIIPASKNIDLANSNWSLTSSETLMIFLLVSYEFSNLSLLEVATIWSDTVHTSPIARLPTYPTIIIPNSNTIFSIIIVITVITTFSLKNTIYVEKGTKS